LRARHELMFLQEVKGTLPELKSICRLLKANATPTTSLDFESDLEQPTNRQSHKHLVWRTTLFHENRRRHRKWRGNNDKWDAAFQHDIDITEFGLFMAITRRGKRTIYEVIKKITDNNIGNDGAQFIREALETNTSLTELKLHGGG